MSQKRFALIGYPLAHSRSAQLYNKVFAELKVAAVYENRELPPEELPRFFSNEIYNYDGLNITIPYKTVLFNYLKICSHQDNGGAINCLLRKQKRFFGYNTDIIGIARALHGVPLKKCRVLVFGAGGAARALFFYLKQKKISELKVVGRNLSKVLMVVEDYSWKKFQIVSWKNELVREAIKEVDLLVNATPLGMQGYPACWKLPDDIDLHGKLCFDLVYNPQKTEFLSWAEKRGAQTISGLKMFLEQASCNLEIFLGLKVEAGLLESYYRQQMEGK